MNLIKTNLETLIDRSYQTYDFISERLMTFYVAGKLTTEEYTELDALARGKYGIPALEQQSAMPEKAGTRNDQGASWDVQDRGPGQDGPAQPGEMEVVRTKYKKRPAVMEAYRTDREVIVHTPEGDQKASAGDYIITGENGEQYPCKPELFEKTYEEVAE